MFHCHFHDLFYFKTPKQVFFNVINIWTLLPHYNTIINYTFSFNVNIYSGKVHISKESCVRLLGGNTLKTSQYIIQSRGKDAGVKDVDETFIVAGKRKSR